MGHAKATTASSKSAPVSSSEELAASLLVEKRELEVDKLFKACVKLEGSDLHLKVGTPPIVRCKGDLKTLNRPAIEVEEMVRLLIPMLDETDGSSKRRAELTFLIRLTSKAKIGDSESTCSNNSVGLV